VRVPRTYTAQEVGSATPEILAYARACAADLAVERGWQGWAALAGGAAGRELAQDCRVFLSRSWGRARQAEGGLR
jgi:hypothetical protein